MTRPNLAHPRLWFDRNAWLMLFFVTALILFSLILTVYRTTLPTDGWISHEPDGFDSFGFIYSQDVLGLPSDLQVGDHLIAVEGISLDTDGLNTALFALRPLWQAGSRVHYTVIRAGEALEIEVPLAHWQASSLWNNPISTHLVILLSLGVFLAVGYITFLKRPENPAARALLWLGMAWMSVALVSGPTPLAVQDQISPFAALSLALLITASFTVLIPPAHIRFGLVFPRPKSWLDRRPWIAYLPYGIGIIGVFAFLNGFFVFGWVWTAVSILILLALLLHSAFTLRDAISRAQMRWGLGGLLLGLGIFFLTYIPIFYPVNETVEAFIASWSAAGFGVMGISLGIAILRYRLFDIDLIIRRTLVYGALTLTLALVYFGSVVVLQRIFQALTGQGESPLVIVISTLVIAALANPLRRRIQSVIDRRFYRQRYNAEQTMEAFADGLRQELDLDQISQRLMKTVSESMQPELTSLWVREAGKVTIIHNQQDKRTV